MDKTLAIIVAFIVISVIMAGILAMGAVPQIFKSAEKIRETQQLVNQTQIQLHEDEARKIQSQELLKQVENIVLSNNERLEYYIDKQNNTTHKILHNQEIMLDSLRYTTEQNLNISKEHETVQEDHNLIQEKVNNLTGENNRLNKEILGILQKQFNTQH